MRMCKQDYELVSQIARRAVEMYQEIQGPMSKQAAATLHRTILMDVTCVHSTACPLRLDELLKADRLDFSHDVFGIYRHLNRESGMLMDCFLPRFARRITCATKCRHVVS